MPARAPYRSPRRRGVRTPGASLRKVCPFIQIITTAAGRRRTTKARRGSVGTHRLRAALRDAARTGAEVRSASALLHGADRIARFTTRIGGGRSGAAVRAHQPAASLRYGRPAGWMAAPQRAGLIGGFVQRNRKHFRYNEALRKSASPEGREPVQAIEFGGSRFTSSGGCADRSRAAGTQRRRHAQRPRDRRADRGTVRISHAGFLDRAAHFAARSFIATALE